MANNSLFFSTWYEYHFKSGKLDNSFSIISTTGNPDNSLPCNAATPPPP